MLKHGKFPAIIQVVMETKMAVRIQGRWNKGPYSSPPPPQLSKEEFNYAFFCFVLRKNEQKCAQDAGKNVLLATVFQNFSGRHIPDPLKKCMFSLLPSPQQKKIPVLLHRPWSIRSDKLKRFYSNELPEICAQFIDFNNQKSRTQLAAADL